MKCEHCNKDIVKPIQESKEDYWKCSCGDYHKVFPYVCPVKVLKRDIIDIWHTSSSDRDFRTDVLHLISQID